MEISAFRPCSLSARRLWWTALLLVAAPLSGAEMSSSPLAKSMEQELNILEHDLVPLAEAMPPALYDFAPTSGEFKDVRTFGQQVMHVATNIYGAAGTVLGEKPPAAMGDGNNGPQELKTKEQILGYLRGSMDYARRAMASLTVANAMDEVDPGWGKHSRLFMANVVLWHSFDHYGQMVIYARLNGIVPPASRPKK
ncbi:DinB family protein [Opitutus terrae]|uniref:DinB-like domain-containing protein n=1 Tax=Opitutus terrae (strain DSM 11246 / JCM 15787 / PB90-1) TaxID=452637 RepID=B1ZZT6_OPITP|nr:DinB family protein [Opitutus terrae]ACB77272.1 conserved hypothetical protein [Opitutus terrae PB90-1]